MNPHAQKLCAWCGLVPATTHVLETDACARCAAATPKVRVQRSLLQWKEGAKR